MGGDELEKVIEEAHGWNPDRPRISEAEAKHYREHGWNAAVGKSTAEAQMGFSLNDFHRINAERCAKDFAPEHNLTALVVCVQEEVGELAGAVLGVTGEKARKKHKTREDVLDAVADAMTYLSLVAWRVGETDLEGLLADTFNMVSERVGSPRKVQGGRK